MNSENFVYWLQGFLEISSANGNSAISLDSDQVKVIQDHIALVLKKVTPTQTIIVGGSTSIPAYPNPNQLTIPYDPKKPFGPFTVECTTTPNLIADSTVLSKDSLVSYCSSVKL